MMNIIYDLTVYFFLGSTGSRASKLGGLLIGRGVCLPFTPRRVLCL